MKVIVNNANIFECPNKLKTHFDKSFYCVKTDIEINILQI